MPGLLHTMKHPLLIAIGSLILGIGIGALATARLSTNKTATLSEDLKASSTRKPPSKSKRGHPRKAPSPGVQLQISPSFSVNNEELEALTIEEVKAKLLELDQALPGAAFQFQRHSLYAHWVKLDPEGAWDAVLQMKKRSIRDQMVSSVISQIARSDVPTAQHLIESIKEPRIKQSALAALVHVAAGTDPVLALQLATEDPFLAHQPHHLHNIFSQWTQIDPESALVAAQNLRRPDQKYQAESAIVNAFAQTNPERALQFAQSIEHSDQRNAHLHSVLNTIARTEPKRAVQLLGELDFGNMRHSVIGSIASTWASQDSHAALEWVKTLSPREQSSALSNGMSYFIQSAPEALAQILSNLPLSSNTNQHFSSLASNWAQYDPEATSAWIETLPTGGARNNALSNLVSTLSQTDPRKAAQILTAEGVTAHNSNQINSLMANWIKIAPDEAVAWANELPLTPSVRRSMLQSTITQWATQDLAAARQFTMGLTDSGERVSAARALVTSWSKSAPLEAQSWVMDTLVGDEQGYAMGDLITQVASQDPSVAFSIYQDAMAGLSPEATKKYFGSSLSQIASYWSRHNPAAAGEWILSLPENEQRASAVDRIVDGWSDQDLEGAADFVMGLTEGTERDRAVSRLISETRQNDPEAAYLWATSIGEDQKRESQIRNTIDNWQRYDPTAARAALDTADLSQDAKTKMLNSWDQ